MYSNFDCLIFEVIAATITSSPELFHLLEDIISAGRCFAVEKSVKGKGSKTTSPVLHSIINSIFRIIPKCYRTLSEHSPAKTFNDFVVHSAGVKILLISIYEVRQKLPPCRGFPRSYLLFNLFYRKLFHMPILASTLMKKQWIGLKGTHSRRHHHPHPARHSRQQKTHARNVPARPFCPAAALQCPSIALCEGGAKRGSPACRQAGLAKEGDTLTAKSARYILTADFIGTQLAIMV